MQRSVLYLLLFLLIGGPANTLAYCVSYPTYLDMNPALSKSGEIVSHGGNDASGLGWASDGVKWKHQYEFGTESVSIPSIDKGDKPIDSETVAPVSEPAMMILFGAGLLGLAGFTRKRKINHLTPQSKEHTHLHVPRQIGLKTVDT